VIQLQRWPWCAGADAVERTGLRRFLEALEWDEPIHSNPDAARAAGHPDVVVPASSHTLFAMPPYWAPGDPPAAPGDEPLLPRMAFFDAFPAQSRTFNLGFRRERHSDIPLGEHLGCAYEVVSVIPKRLSIGDGSIVEIAARYETRNGSPASTGTFRIFNYVPDARAEASSSAPSGTSTPAGRIESVTITHTRQRLAMWAGANQDYAPWHHDPDWARAGGAPDAFANTFFIDALFERLLRRIVGSRGIVESIDFRIASFLLPAPQVEVLAILPDRPLAPGERFELPIEQRLGDVVTAHGTGVVVIGNGP
jgi:3-methylfumaryl-CoA hydratase